MLRIAVCDDEEDVAKVMCVQVKERLPSCETQIFLSGNALLEADNFDIVFLDVQMEGMKGLDIAKRLRQRNEDTKIIFVTAAKDYVFEAFDVAAFHYLLKPVDAAKLNKVLERAVQDIRKRERKTVKTDGRQQLLIKTRYKTIAVDVADIYYLENAGRKIVVHTRQETMEFYAVMTQLEQELGTEFFRCHRGYLVNMDYVVKYDGGSIWLTNGDVIYLAKGRYHAFEKQYKRFLADKE